MDGGAGTILDLPWTRTEAEKPQAENTGEQGGYWYDGGDPGAVWREEREGEG